MADLLHPAIAACLTDIDRQGKSALTCAGYRRALVNFVHWAVESDDDARRQLVNQVRSQVR